VSGSALQAWYVYSVLPAAAAAPPALQLPGPPVAAVPVGAFTVLTSLVNRALFDAEHTANRTADPEWMAGWMQAHHAVNAAATAAGPCLPLAFGALFSSLEVLAEWLAPRQAALLRTLAQVSRQTEWALSVQEDATLHDQWLDQADPTLRRLAQAAARAGAGTAFLIARQRQGAAVTARAASLAAAAATIEQHLREAGFEIVAEPARADLPHWTVLERGDPDRRSLLRVRLEKLAAELAPSGLSLRLTGPWPAYRAARAATEETVNG
jgi:hypothetical protein